MAVTFRHVHEVTEADVTGIVEPLFGIGIDRTRKLLREGGGRC